MTPTYRRLAVVASIFVLLVALFLRTGDHETYHTDDDSNSLLQVGSMFQEQQQQDIDLNPILERAKSAIAAGGVDLANQGHRGECGGPGIHLKDFTRPIREVLAEHPGIDGWCYFGWLGDWARKCAVARQKHDYSYFAEFFDKYTDSIKNGNGLPVEIVYEGGKFITRDHNHPLDDALCDANGYWDYPADKVLHDFDYLTQVSKTHCQKLQAEVPNYHNISMADFFEEEFGDDKKFANVENGFGDAGVLKLVLKPNMLLHEAVKCLLGGAECDIAFCARRGCKGDDGIVRYGAECRAESPL